MQPIQQQFCAETVQPSAAPLAGTETHALALSIKHGGKITHTI